MAQDFAKQRTAQSPTARKGVRTNVRPAAKSASWNTFISGVFTGALLVVIAYFAYQRYQAEQPSIAEALNAAKTEELPAFAFDFYKELANAEVAVSVPPDPAPALAPTTTAPTTTAPAGAALSTTTTATATSNTATASAAPAPTKTVTLNYLLQAGSFQERKEADDRRAKITLLNMSADIVPGVVAGRTWYRVQVGPFAGRPPAEEARKTLSANNIDSILLLMR
jgi:cell division protein FtsN